MVTYGSSRCALLVRLAKVGMSLRGADLSLEEMAFALVVDFIGLMCEQRRGGQPGGGI